jgi:hypothetical protein
MARHPKVPGQFRGGQPAKEGFPFFRAILPGIELLAAALRRLLYFIAPALSPAAALSWH